MDRVEEETKCASNFPQKILISVNYLAMDAKIVTDLLFPPSAFFIILSTFKICDNKLVLELSQHQN